MTAFTSINKVAVARAFNRAASKYDHYAALQRHVGKTLLSLDNDPLPPYQSVLDAGCGTGYFSRGFHDKGSTVTAGDLAIDMLKQAQKNQVASHYVACDLESLPFADRHFCLTFSNLALQWCPHLKHALAHLCRVSRRRVLFTTLLSDSLYELAIVGNALDGRSRRNAFLSLPDILAACPAHGLRWQTALHVMQYTNLRDLLTDLRGTGANYMPKATTRIRYRRNYIDHLENVYLTQFGRIQLTYRIFYGVIDLT